MKKLDTWIWLLIFGGLLLVGLGLAVATRDDGLGSTILWAGGLAAAVGVLLVFVRARQGDGGDS